MTAMANFEATMPMTRTVAEPEEPSKMGDLPGHGDWDRAACERFVESQYEGVFAWFCWLTGRRDRAADLTQETFAAFWVSLSRTAVRDPRVWLFRIARNQWRKWCRNARRRGNEALTADPPSMQPGPSERVADAECARCVRNLVMELPSIYREAVVLCYWCDMSPKQIARVLGVPSALARWRTHHGRSLLRSWIESAEGGTEDRGHA